MNPVFAIAQSIISSLGNSAEENFESVKNGQIGIKEYQDAQFGNMPFWASRLMSSQIEMLHSLYTNHTSIELSTFEQMCVFVAEQALKNTDIDVSLHDCVFILSTTKGNIEQIDVKQDDHLLLYESAKKISKYFKNSNKPLVFSNACISGSMALIMAKRLLENNKYKYAIVIGADRLSSFVLNGFRSFQAIANGLCRPFDKDRNGINLGEAAGCVILSNELSCADPKIQLVGGAISNDANHLSGPSKTGEELSNAITHSLREAGIKPNEIKAVSAHGTATIYNDEMEAKALHHAGVAHAYVHSLKGYIGHTLGASGIIESILSYMSMNNNLFLASKGFQNNGVSKAINISEETQSVRYCYLLKTSSGFGGCNAAIIWENKLI